MSGDLELSLWEFDVLAAVKEVADSEDSRNHAFLEPRQGWLTNIDVRSFLGSPSHSTRNALRVLAVRGFLSEKVFRSARHFRLSQKGIDRLKQGPPSEEANVYQSSSWTGTIEPVQAERALALVSEMEDVCELMVSNHDRAQIMGLVKALEILLTVPEPPRAGVVALVRDPAFANVVQVATLIAALIGALK